MTNHLSVLITIPAKSDISDIITFVANDNPKAAIGVLNIFEQTFRMLADFPAAGIQKNITEDKSVRIYTIRKRYSVVYRVKNNTLEILRVLTKYQDLFAIL